MHRWPLPHGGQGVDRARMRSDINAWRLCRAFFFYTRALMRMRRGEPPVYFAAIPCRNDAGSAALLDREYFCRIRRKRRSFYSRNKKEYRRALYWQREKRLFNLRFLRTCPGGGVSAPAPGGVGSLLCPAPPRRLRGRAGIFEKCRGEKDRARGGGGVEVPKVAMRAYTRVRVRW